LEGFGFRAGAVADMPRVEGRFRSGLLDVVRFSTGAMSLGPCKRYGIREGDGPVCGFRVLSV